MSYRAVSTAAASPVQQRAAAKTNSPSVITKRGNTTKLVKAQTTQHRILSSNNNSSRHTNTAHCKTSNVQKLSVNKVIGQTVQKSPITKTNGEDDKQNVNNAACKTNKTV